MWAALGLRLEPTEEAGHILVDGIFSQALVSLVIRSTDAVHATDQTFHIFRLLDSRTASLQTYAYCRT